MKTELQKCLDGEPYTTRDPEISGIMRSVHAMKEKYNSIPYDRTEEKDALIRKMLGHVGENCTILSPFVCEFGFTVSVGDNFFSNIGLNLNDQGGISIGDNCMFGPNVSLITANHPKDTLERRSGMTSGKPITVGNDVWIGANVLILPGVTIGDNVIIGAGSLVTKDISSDSLALGSPARVVESLKG